MFDIVTLEPEDAIVMTAINAIVNGKGAIPSPSGNYRLVVPGDLQVEGDGGTGSKVLVVVAHGSVNSLSGYPTWAAFRDEVGNRVPWTEKTTVYLAACSNAGEDGTQFLHGSIANEVKAAFPGATVWASSSDVSADTQSGDWHKL